MSDLLTALAAIFIVAGALLLVANHYSLATTPFLIFAGVIAGLFIETVLLLELAQWGIAFLVFTFGVDLDLQTIRTLARDSEVTTGIQVAIVGTLGFVAGIGLGFDALNAVYFSIAAALSSTIVGAGLLQEEIRANLVYGRLARSVHFIQDLLAILFILILSADAFTLDVISSNIGYGVMLLAAAYVFNNHLFDQISRFADGSQELLMVGAVAILIGFLATAEFVGISIVVGAFAAGLAIKRDFTRNLGMLNGIESIRDFFVAVFFVTLGALVFVRAPDLTVLATAAILIVLTALIKPIVTLFTLLWEGYDTRTATLTSVSLDQVSEFALIIAIEAFIAGLLVEQLFDAIILTAAVTMIIASYTRRRDERLYQLLAQSGLLRSPHRKMDARSRVDLEMTDHVIIVGFGRQARRLIEKCETREIPYVVIENDPSMYSQLEESCRHFVFGDAMQEYTWEKANSESAALIISSIDQRRVSDRLFALDTDADIIPRTATVQTAEELLSQGAMYVVVPDLLASDRLVEHILAIAGDDMYRDRIRERHLEELDEFETAGFNSMNETGDPS